MPDSGEKCLKKIVDSKLDICYHYANIMEIVVTNNPMVRDKFSEAGKSHNQLEFLDTDYMGVLKAVRDRVHVGSRLVTHPLSGSVKPGETPYKTVILSSGECKLDEEALHIIEESIQTCQKLTAGKKRDWRADLLADFQLIDFSLIFSGR